MKVLYISHSHEGSGFSIAAHGYINALVAGGYDIVCRHIKLNNANPEIPQIVLDCEAKSLDGVEAVIQHVLPHHMSYIPGIKNIGLCVHDTSTLKYVGWDRYLNCMDEIWIPQWVPFMDELTSPVKYVPHAFDTSKYSKDFKPLEIREIGGTCVFYTIFDLNIRKNVRDTIQAFHTEFHTNEPVTLLLKTSAGGYSTQDIINIMNSSVNDIKNDLKLYPKIEDYHSESIIIDRLSDEQINQLHTLGDCYVNTSHGEGWLIPQFDAWAFGNQIVSYESNVQTYEYLDRFTTNFVPCPKTDVLGYKETFPELGSSRESWTGSNIPELRAAMRLTFNNWLGGHKKVKVDYEQYSYESVGKIIKGIL